MLIPQFARVGAGLLGLCTSTPRLFASRITAILPEQINCLNGGRCEKGTRNPGFRPGRIRTLATASSGTTALTAGSAHGTRFLWNVLIMRKGDPAFIVTRVSDQDVMELSGDDSMHVRDLGLLHSQEQRQRMDIIVRDSSLLMRMLHVRAVLQKDMLMLFNAESVAVQEIAADFARIAKDVPDDPREWEASFEALALETVLKHLIRKLDQRLLQMQPLACALLREMEINVSSDSLRKLLPIKEVVGQLKNSTEAVADVLQNLIADDFSLRCLDLSGTRKHQKGDVGSARRSQQVQQTERLLEFFRREVMDVARDVSLLDQKIDDTREVLNVALDSQRNRILKFNMELSLVAMTIAVFALPSAFFGMNVTHGWEETPGVFPAILSAAGAFSLALYMLMSQYLRQGIARSSKTTAQEIKALRNVLSMLDSIETVFSTKAKSHEIGREKFKRELLRATGRADISEVEMDIICQVFDDDADGQLQFETFEHILQHSKDVIQKGAPLDSSATQP